MSGVTLLYLVAGLAVGWLLTMLADVLPRYAVTVPPDLKPHGRAPALWRALRGQRAQHPATPLELATELVTGAAFALASAVPTLQALALCGACAFFILIAVIDIRYRLILNVTMLGAFAAVAALHIVGGALTLTSVLLGAGFAFFIFYMTARLKPGQLGMGDVKLATLIGFAFGFPGVMFALLIGVGAGALAAVALLLRRRGARSTTIPYAPFLCLGALALLFSPVLIR